MPRVTSQFTTTRAPPGKQRLIPPWRPRTPSRSFSSILLKFQERRSQRRPTCQVSGLGSNRSAAAKGGRRFSELLLLRLTAIDMKVDEEPSASAGRRNSQKTAASVLSMALVDERVRRRPEVQVAEPCVAHWCRGQDRHHPDDRICRSRPAAHARRVLLGAGPEAESGCRVPHSPTGRAPLDPRRAFRSSSPVLHRRRKMRIAPAFMSPSAGPADAPVNGGSP